MTEHSSTRVISYLCGPTDDHYTVRWPTGPSKSEVRIPSRRAWTPPATVAARRATTTYRYIGTALLLHVAACRSPVETSPRGLERFFRSTIRSHVRNVFPFPRPYRPPYGELVTHSRLFRRHFPDSDRGSEVSYYRNGTVDHLRSSNG